jgi:hypothetical protein
VDTLPNRSELYKYIVPDLFPGEAEMLREWDKLKKYAQDSENHDDRYGPLTSEEKRFLKFRYPFTFRKDFERAGPALACYFDALPRRIRESRFITDVMQTLFDAYSEHTALVYLSNVSKFVIRFNARIDKFMGGEIADYRYLAHLNNGFGFVGQTRVRDEVGIEGATDWLKKRAKFQLNGIPYLKRFSRALQKVIGKYSTPTGPEYQTAEEFAKDFISWGGTGAGVGAPIKARWKDKEISLRKNKYLLAFRETPSQIVARLLSVHSVDSKMFVKPDEAAPKERFIVSGDMDTYLKMTFLKAEQLFRNLPSPLSLGSSGMVEERMKMVDLVRRRTPNMPLDQSSFDHQISKEMILMTLRAMRDMAVPFASAEVARVWEGLIEQIAKTDLVYEKNGKELFRKPWTSGLLSGWRWTALLNTIINLSELQVAEDINAEMGMPRAITFANAMGDDDVLFGPSIGGMLGVFFGYVSVMGREAINAKKFFVSRVTSEYLRKVYSSEGEFGYPARMLNSIFWRKPTSSGESDGKARLTEIYDSWTKFISRGMDRNYCFEWMLNDMAGSLKVDRSIVNEILHTPAALGGFDVRPFTATPIAIETTITEIATISRDQGFVIEEPLANELIPRLFDLPRTPEWKFVEKQYPRMSTYVLGGMPSRGPNWRSDLSVTDQVMVKIAYVNDPEFDMSQYVLNWSWAKNRLTRRVRNKWLNGVTFSAGSLDRAEDYVAYVTRQWSNGVWYVRPSYGKAMTEEFIIAYGLAVSRAYDKHISRTEDPFIGK